MTPESLWNDIETWNNRSDLPEQLEWIQNRNDFLDVFKNIKSWYWENFSDGDIRLIKDSRKSSCAEYWSSFTSTQKAIAANRIDSALFRAHYPKFFNLDKKYIMGTIPNTITQRKFREIVIKLRNTFGELYNSEVEKIETKLQSEIKKQPRSDSPIFDTLHEELANTIANNRDISPETIYNDETNLWDKWQNFPWRIPEEEINSMVNIQISNEFLNMRNEVFSYISFEELWYLKWNTEVNDDEEWIRKEVDENQINYVKKYATAIFNDFAKQITDYWDGNIPDSFYSNPNTIQIVTEHMRRIVNGEETDTTKLLEDIEEELFNYDEFIWSAIGDIAKESEKVLEKIDPEKLEKIEIDNQELNDIRVNLNTENSGELMDKLIEAYRLKKYLEQKRQEIWKLDTDQETLLKKLDDLFKNIKKRVLRDINDKREDVYTRNTNYKSLNISPEYATWNIKDIQPAAIVENNENIWRYVYWTWNNNHNETNSDIDYSSLDNNIKIDLFRELKEQKQWDIIFLESIKYLNDDLSINTNLVNASGVDMQSVISNQKKIEKMIMQLAAEKKMEQSDKDEINDINVKKSCMICCFRAISSFFDTSNTNWENFASQFEIEDVDEDINFDAETWVITMKGTIWANNNHIKLYYNTKTWELSFDNFLAYNFQDKCYKIWKWNNEREILNVKLPTMKDMEKSAKSVNYNLIDSLALNTRQYSRMVWRAMRESIWFECFQWFMWVNMDVNKQFVAQFNERNILKQDIIKSIYKKFYNESDINEKFDSYLTISEGNEPEQFKLIKLISDSIDFYDNANDLLRFRQHVDQLDEILTTNHEVVEMDDLLKYLFADNPNKRSDVVDESKNIMRKENEDLTIWNGNWIIQTYEDQWNNIAQESAWNQQLNYYTFLDLLAEDKWMNRIINLDEFWSVLDTIGKIKSSWLEVLDNKNWILRDNYRKKVDNWEMADVYDLMLENYQ